MGCGTTKEKIQTDILVLQLEKAEIQEQRERLIHQLEILNGKKGYSQYYSFSNKYGERKNQTSRCATADSDCWKNLFLIFFVDKNCKSFN